MQPDVGIRVPSEGEHVSVREPGGDGDGSRIVTGDHHAFAGGSGEADEGLLEGLFRAVVVEMVGVDVRDEGDRGVVEQEGAVGFIRFHYEVRAGAARGADTERADHSPVDEARIRPEGEHRGHDHGGGGGLAVGARDRHHPVVTGEPGEGLRAVHDRQTTIASRPVLWVVLADRPGDDDRVGAIDVFGSMADGDGDPAGA